MGFLETSILEDKPTEITMSSHIVVGFFLLTKFVT